MVFSCSEAGMPSRRPNSSSSNWDTKSQMTCNGFPNHEQSKIQEDFRQRINGQDEATRDNLSLDEDFRLTHDVNGINRRNIDPSRERQLKNQRRWMLLLFHAKRCKAPQGKCQEIHCLQVQQLLKHMDTCTNTMPPCKFPRCHHTKVLIAHYKRCSDSFCAVCVPVKNFMETQLKARFNPNTPVGGPNSVKNRESLEDVQTSFKRIKVEKPSQPHMPSQSRMPSQSHMPLSVPSYGYRNNVPSITPMKSELTEVKIEVSCDMKKEKIVGASDKPPLVTRPSHEYIYNDPSCTSMQTELTEVKIEISCDMNKDKIGGTHNQIPANEPSSTLIGPSKKEDSKSEMEVDQCKTECSVAIVSGTKSERQKIKGVSLTELFTPDEVREHIRGLRQWVGQLG